ncbi:ECF transporter S component [Pseudoflavonifractor sp. 524-17]|uniref:ECF transporter S component n=1 Tax=Pseudoflavonifractor sp. 524-17 TaxID=2304577 RepID=UPI00137AD449|nr:ECF transporter S component [Pseudoflavonifractor sp. 524-17]NCE64586.1 ECF transporter S component [Pseudoflavonifractor sp. 524-17]
MEKANVNPKIGRMVRVAVLVAIIFLLSFTPLGYLVIGPIAATTIQMPVIIGAALMGPAAGAVLGGFFGLSALIKVLTMPGADVVATAILGVEPLVYIFIAMVPRILMGWLSGLLMRGLHKVPALDKQHLIGYGITGFLGSLMNTVFYLGGLWMLASNYVAQAYQVDISAVGTMVMGVATTAGIPEALVSCVVVAAVCRALEAMDKTL